MEVVLFRIPLLSDPFFVLQCRDFDIHTKNVLTRIELKDDAQAIFEEADS